MNSLKTWTQISDHLFAFEDTCIVYAIVREGEAVFIDFGSGSVMDHMGEIGVHRIRAILHTHHHRDQCQGDARAVREGIPIYVPEHERHLFEHAELYWASKQLFDMYNVRNTYFSLTRNIPVAGVLEDFGAWKWDEIEFQIIPTPGHTYGSQTLLLELDGRRIAFTGDLLYAAGKVVTMYDMQYGYGAVDGVEYAILSMVNLESRQPHVLCPSHGTLMDDSISALRETRLRLSSFFSLMMGGVKPVNEIDFIPLLPHVLAATYACAFFYVITSDSGKALLVDYGSPNFQLFAPANRYYEDWERVRFVEHSLDRLRDQYGITKIEAVIPSHYHDDHINGIPYLQKHMGVECWAYENMKEILENNRGELIGCVLPTPIKVHRTFRDRERLVWEGLEFSIHHTPGHADYHMGMFGMVDGHSIAFSGDNLFPTPEGNVIPSLIYRNHVHKTSHLQTARLYMEYQPDILCTGHDLKREVKPQIYQAFLQNAQSLTHHFELLVAGETNYGLEPGWIQIYPYQSVAKPGDCLDLQIRMQNYFDREVSAEIRLVLPEGWVAEPDIVRLNLTATSRAVGEVRVYIPSTYSFHLPRVALAADVTLDGKYLGQVAEATVEKLA